MSFALVITVKNEANTLPYNLLYHNYLGANKIFIYDDGCTDKTLNNISAIPNTDIIETTNREVSSNKYEFINRLTYPRCDYQFRMMINAYDALLECRRQNIEWLIMLDADEFVCPSDNHYYPGQLDDFFSSIDTDVAAVQFTTKEVLQRKFQYKNVFLEENLFKCSSKELKKNSIITIDGGNHQYRPSMWVLGVSRIPIIRDYYNQIFQNATPIRRWIYHPLKKLFLISNGFYGQTSGKMAIRTKLDFYPTNTHAFERNEKQPFQVALKGSLLHYQFHSYSEFIRKPILHPLPELLESVQNLNPIKKMFFEISYSDKFTDIELENYYKKWIMFGDLEVEKLLLMSTKKSRGHVPPLAKIETVSEIINNCSLGTIA